MAMSKRVLIVGAGTGGLMVANALARRLASEIRQGEIELTVLDPRSEYVYQPGFLYIPFDLMRPEELRRPIKELLDPSVHFILDAASRVNPDARLVETGHNGNLPYDYLVLATGSHLNLKEIPGLEEGAHWFYTLDGALRLRDALRHFERGRLVVAVGLPHKCPVAPLEFTFMFDAWARQRGIRKHIEILYTFPINGAHSIKSCSEWAIREFAARDITLETFCNIESVDPGRKMMSSIEGLEYPYDLLVTVPPHMGAQVGVDSGLAEPGGWLPTDRHSLNLQGRADVFVLGDATNVPTSKAGSVAHYESEVISENLISLLHGEEPGRRYDGKTFCFVEADLSRATILQFDFEHPPMVGTANQAVHWFKQAYNRIHWLNLKGIM